MFWLVTTLNFLEGRTIEWMCENNMVKVNYGLALLLGIGISTLFFVSQIVAGDQTQMLYKGYLGAYEGVWLSYGNAASAVGNVPGSLSAWLIGGPLLLWDSPYAPMLLLLAMRLVGFLLFDAGDPAGV